MMTINPRALEIVKAAPLKSFEKEEALEALLQAQACYLENDLRVGVAAVEDWTENPGIRLKGILDLVLSGDRVVDWKAASSAVDWKYKNRLRHSWQWKIYCFLRGAKKFEYRIYSYGVRAWQTIYLTAYDGLEDEVWSLVLGAQRMKESLGLFDFPYWPRPNMPSCCNAYNRKCEFWDDCTGGVITQIGNHVIEDTWWSYSRIKDFGECPEKFRRKTERREEDGKWLQNTVLHAALAETWRNAAGLGSV
jgi:hypothetical protein